MFFDTDADVCDTWHDLPFHIVSDLYMQGVAFCQMDGVDVEGILKKVDAIPFLVAFFVEEFAVDGISASVA